MYIIAPCLVNFIMADIERYTSALVPKCTSYQIEYTSRTICNLYRCIVCVGSLLVRAYSPCNGQDASGPLSSFYQTQNVARISLHFFYRPQGPWNGFQSGEAWSLKVVVVEHNIF